MYYVVRKEEDISSYHYIFIGEDAYKKAKASAKNLKHYLGHDYDVIKVETVWTTQTLDEAMRG
jgi:hypothetical protein